MVDCNQFDCHISQSCHPHRGCVCVGGGGLNILSRSFSSGRSNVPNLVASPLPSHMQTLRLHINVEKKVVTERVWLTGQRCVNGCWDLERKSCSVIIKKSVWRVQMELSQWSMSTHVCGVHGILRSGLKLSAKKKKNDLVSGDMLIFEVSLRSFEQMQKYQTNSQGLVQAPGLGKVSGALKNYSSVDPQISVCRDHRRTRPFWFDYRPCPTTQACDVFNLSTNISAAIGGNVSALNLLILNLCGHPIIQAC